MQIVFTPEKWAFLFPRKDSWHSPMAVTSLATVLVMSCFCAGAREPSGLLSQLITVEPHAKTPCRCSPHLHECPPEAMSCHCKSGAKEHFYCGSIRVWLHYQLLQKKFPLSWDIPGCDPHCSSLVRYLGYCRANAASGNVFAGTFYFDPADLSNTRS